MEPVVIILIALIFIPLAFMLRQSKENNFAEQLSQAVAERGGTVVSMETRSFRKGPFWVKGKGQIVMKVVWQDAAGDRHQLWGRTGVFGDDLVWDYDDGDNG